MLILGVIYCIYLIILTFMVAYLFVLAVSSLFARKPGDEYPQGFRFLILIPAHNEEKGIAATLAGLKLLTRPGPTDVVVIADNCDDQTAGIARESGAEVIERHDKQNRGKGYALQWALSQQDLNQYDAVAIVDADTQVQPNMLLAMAASLSSGHGAVQLNYRFTGSKASPLAALQEMASQVENKLFYRGRAVLGLPILLRGSGMAILTDVLKRHPWDSHSITEDVDYAVNLISKGVSITFSDRSSVDSAATSTYGQSLGQKKRWASGTILMIKEKASPLLWRGISHGRMELVELALSFFLLSRPAMIFMIAPILPLSIFAPDGIRLIFFFWAAILILALIIYLLLGIFYVKNKLAALKALLHVPAYAFWYLKVTVSAILDHKDSDWVRTDRE